MAHTATKHFAIIDVVVTDDFVDRRTKAANAVATRWRKLPNALAALTKASLLADGLVSAATGGPVPLALRQEVGADINRHAPTHDANDPAHDFEVAIVAAVAAIMVLDGAASRSEHCKIFAEALSAAMDISSAKGAPKIAGLWDELSQVARTTGENAAENVRKRAGVDVSDLSAAIQTLAENGRKDAEEINVLWWTLNDWSALGNAPLSSMTTPEGAIAAGLELTSLLEWPAVRAHHQLAHRNLVGRANGLALKDLRVEDEALRGRVNSALASLINLIGEHPKVFIALVSVTASDQAAASAKFTAAQIEEDQVMAAWRWCERLVREVSLAKSTGAKLGSLE